jgi:hypothetical protein
LTDTAMERRAIEKDRMVGASLVRNTTSSTDVVK